jgi:hypothetical protein
MVFTIEMKPFEIASFLVNEGRPSTVYTANVAAEVLLDQASKYVI